ncbi:MAG: type II secretion system ATPase GspE [Pseudomonadota bacterium]|nr:type II secretion system ATPase GspE [Pseudomonadota bacterium]
MADSLPIDPAIVRRIPYHAARGQGVVAARQVGDAIEVWVRQGAGAAALAEARRVLAAPLLPVLLAADEFDARLAQAYAREETHASQIMDDLEQEIDLLALAQEIPTVGDLLESEDDAPIIRLINALLAQALREGASDIHLEAYENRSVLRYRVDGILRDVMAPPRALHAALVSRIKVMASLDNAEKRLPQDGRISLRVAGRPVDVRVSTLPTGHGERVVLRLLDKQHGRLELEALGMNPTTLSALDSLIRAPHGIILVTGPTGSGKTTTLYAALSRLDASRLNIMTVEDPIEYDLDQISQTHVNPRIDLTFARALRAILRQDPDVVMIGEIRDLETAQIAVQASLTGHLVLATLHTNDALGAVTRLADMGVEPYLLATSLIGVLGQRLVRRLCPACKRGEPPDAAEQAALAEFAVAQVMHAVGCPECNQTGYRGRTGVYELFSLTDAARRLIHDGASEAVLREIAAGSGWISLYDDGLRWVAAGETTLEEVMRVARA